MKSAFLIIVTFISAAFIGATGCRSIAHRIKEFRDPSPPTAPVTYSQFHHSNFMWDGVARVVVLPVTNRSEFTRAGSELRNALTSELQRLGRFETIRFPDDDGSELAERIHHNGAFDEAAILAIARESRADVLIHVAITQYSPYPRPRMGLVVQAVSPLDAKVIASVDGLWDTTDSGIAEQVRRFYRQTEKPRPPWIRNHVIATDDAFAGELALESPALFMRYVSNLVSRVLTNSGASTSATTGANGSNANCPPAGRP